MTQIFISYRRSDSAAITGRIYDRLRQELGKDTIFKDVDNIPAGRDFRGVLREATANCAVMLVVIGPSWVSTKDVDGNRRLDDPADFVRLEVETGLKRDDVLVIPLIVSGGTPPRAAELPDSLQELAYNNALLVRDDPDFHHDMDRLIEQLAEHVSKSGSGTKPAPARVMIQPLLRNRAIIAAVMGAIAVIIGAIIVVGPQLFKQEAVPPTSMAQILTSGTIHATPSETTASTATVTPVTQNAAWTPIERDFDGVTMVMVPAGCFMMGSENGEDREEPAHKQCFDAPFWIDKYEVTNAQFVSFEGVASTSSQWIGENHPREQITWLEARDFCELRSAQLPTEQEWEYAARGPDNLEYPWGATWNADNVVWSGNSNNQTAEVGSRPAGGAWVGAQDMAGNVWEWVSSEYEAYPYDGEDNMEDSTSVRRILRGGSWYLSDPFDFRAAFRFDMSPDDGDDDFGFRCARPS